jgi:hypothetical protein
MDIFDSKSITKRRLSVYTDLKDGERRALDHCDIDFARQMNRAAISFAMRYGLCEIVKNQKYENKEKIK